MQTYPMLVTGVFSSGKTQFILSISEIGAVSVESPPPSPVVFDYGYNTITDEVVLRYFGTNGLLRFDPKWILLFEQNFLGLIVMVDSCRPATWWEFRRILWQIQIETDCPFVVAANKQDHPDAWPVEDLRIALKVPAHIPMVPCVARDKESVKRVLLRLLEEVLARCED